MVMTCGLEKPKADKQHPAVLTASHFARAEPGTRTWLLQVPEEDMLSLDAFLNTLVLIYVV